MRNYNPCKIKFSGSSSLLGCVRNYNPCKIKFSGSSSLFGHVRNYNPCKIKFSGSSSLLGHVRSKPQGRVRAALRLSSLYYCHLKKCDFLLLSFK